MKYEKPFAPGTTLAMLFFMALGSKKLIASSSAVSIAGVLVVGHLL